MKEYLLKLYITGQTPKSGRAIANLRRVCEKGLRGKYNLTIIDVLKRPDLARDEKILVTPTLTKEQPPPLRRIIGDLSDTRKVMLALDPGSYEDRPWEPCLYGERAAYLGRCKG